VTEQLDSGVLQPQPATVPGPTPGIFSQPYWDACARGQLIYQQCAACSAINLLPGQRCARCASEDVAWQPSAGRGTLYSWTVVWRPQRPEFQVPYVPAIIDMAEGYRMIAGIIGCTLDDLRAEMPLQVEFHAVANDIQLPYFRPA